MHLRLRTRLCTFSLHRGLVSCYLAQIRLGQIVTIFVLVQVFVRIRDAGVVGLVGLDARARRAAAAGRSARAPARPPHRDGVPLRQQERTTPRQLPQQFAQL